MTTEPSALSTVTIEPAMSASRSTGTFLQSELLVDFTIYTDAGRAHGTTTVGDAGDRVWATTVLHTADGDVTILSHKLDPNEPSNDYSAVANEVSRIEAFTMPVTTSDVDAIASVVHAYVINGRPEWS